MFVSPEKMLYEQLLLNGSGTSQITSDYSSSATPFFVQPPNDETWVIRRMIGSYQDAGGGTMSEYGNLGGALATGIRMKVYDDSVDLKILNDFVKSNGHWGSNCYDVDAKAWGSGDDLFVFRWSFFKDVPEGIVLDGALGHRLGFIANDDFEGLVNHQFNVRGYIVTPTYTV